ncbi:class I SAM-dependent methyltransferase [Ottowia testudinis]|uniref:Class I SAM-dependent methyltransferase n=1 Tax=Ottowia testudinis TaxID=2816950 RepID=A0A975H2G3_9BURK|nr:class I SAM-dependent methyltransferase [Ottowia testudinis]QTD44838.1 class I SAM-dependent methyltransferase [Ottowia testudinis]
MKPITRQNVEYTYGHYARFYDLAFGAVLQAGRRRLCEAVRATAPATVLEVGVGTGLTLAHYPASTAVTGIDLSPEMLAHARQRAAALPGRRIVLDCMDAEQLDFADASFDCVTLPYVLSVTPNPARLTAELRRVCKPGGDIFVLNHFSGGAGVWALPERMISGLAARIGFRSDFPFDEHMRHADWTLQARSRVNLLGLTTLAHMKNTP